MTPLRQRFYARRSFIAGQSLGIVAAIYAASTVVMVTPFVDLQTLDAATFAGDGRLNVWTIAWVSHAIVNGLTLFDANMYFPTPDALAYTEHMSTLGLLAVPVQAFTDNPVLIFAVLWLASFWTNAMAAHILALRLTGRHDAALIAGLIFGWSYFRILHLAHLQLQWTAWMPLGLVLLERWYRSPSAMNSLQATVVSLAQILTSWYLAVISVLLNTLWVCWLAACRFQRPMLPRLLQLAIAGTLGALVVWPFISPYLEVLKPGPVEQLHGGSADLAAYIVPPRNTTIGSLLEHTALEGRWEWGEQTLFLGWLPLALALLACGTLFREAVTIPHQPRTQEFMFFVLLGALGFLLSLGPLGHGAAPFDLLMQVPGLALFRAPARFALLVVLAVSILATYVVARSCSFIEKRWGALAARIVVGALGVAMLAEWYPVGPNVPRAEVKAVPVVYNLLKRLPAGGVMSLPDYRLRSDWFLRADYLLYAAFHWQPIVNGYGRSEPSDYLSIVEQLSTFPSESSAQLAKALGVRYFVIHSDQLDSDAPIKQAIKSELFTLIRHIGSDYLFEVAGS
jgi:hypothetical protein